MRRLVTIYCCVVKQQTGTSKAQCSRPLDNEGKLACDWLKLLLPCGYARERTRRCAGTARCKKVWTQRTKDCMRRCLSPRAFSRFTIECASGRHACMYASLQMPSLVVLRISLQLRCKLYLTMVASLVDIASSCILRRRALLFSILPWSLMSHRLVFDAGGQQR
eukprot:5883940-Pleurochrysis_carterae.AAC.1